MWPGVSNLIVKRLFFFMAHVGTNLNISPISKLLIVPITALIFWLTSPHASMTRKSWKKTRKTKLFFCLFFFFLSSKNLRCFSSIDKKLLKSRELSKQQQCSTLFFFPSELSITGIVQAPHLISYISLMQEM